MLVVLKEKGFDLGERKLARLRTSQGMYFRAPNAPKGIAGAIQSPGSDKSDGEVQANVVSRGTQTDSTDTIFETPADSIPFDTTVSKKSRRASRIRASIPDATDQTLAGFITTPSYPRPAPGELEARERQRVHAETEKSATQEGRKSRRANHEGLKYPSEIGLTQCRKNLGIDKDTYHSMRTAFSNICLARGIERKKGCDIWQTAKDDLIGSIPQLAAVFHDENGQVITGEDLERKALSVDLICMDTTKNLRKQGTQLSIRDAKKELGLTPTQITRVREALTQRLISAEFTSKTEMGEARWKELKDAWLAEMKLDQRGAAVLKACDVICADVVKRLNDKKILKRKRASEGIESQGDAEQESGMSTDGMMSTQIQVAGHGIADHEVGGTALSAYEHPTMMAPIEPAMSVASSYDPSPDFLPYGNYVALADGYSGSAPASSGPYSTSFGLVNSTSTSGPYYTSTPTSGPYYTMAHSPSDSPYPEIDPELVLGWGYQKPKG